MLLLLLVTCFVGYSAGKMKGRVVGGVYASVGEFPYAAFLNIQCINHLRKSSISWRCGSSILNQYVLLTAAHCVDPVTCDDIWITATVGHPDRLKGTVSTAFSYLLHKEYTPEFTADIALVRLKTPLKFNSRVSRVAIMEDPPYSERAYVAGWGRVHPTLNILSEDLKYVGLFVWRKEACVDLLEDAKPGTFCASSNFTGYVSNGDSGGALVVRGYIQIGICSYIKPKTTKTVSIFTDVGYYYNWIKENVNTIMCERK